MPSIFKTKRSSGEPTASMVLTVEEVARYLHVHQSTIYRLLRQKELPAFKVGRTPAKKSSRDRCNVVRRGKTRVLSAEQAHVLGRRSQQFEERFDRPRTRNSGSRAEVFAPVAAQ